MHASARACVQCLERSKWVGIPANDLKRLLASMTDLLHKCARTYVQCLRGQDKPRKYRIQNGCRYQGQVLYMHAYSYSVACPARATEEPAACHNKMCNQVRKHLMCTNACNSKTSNGMRADAVKRLN